MSQSQSELLDALRRLDPTGPSGFEGLIARLLTRLTGSAFYIAKSGRQDGRDMVSDRHLGTRIAVESKRYREDTELNTRELVGEVSQAVATMTDLDLWVLVASRSLDADLLLQLQNTGRRQGIEVETLSSNDGIPSSLETLCAFGLEEVLSFLDPVSVPDPMLSTELQRIQALPSYHDALARLRRTFSPSHIGFGTWRANTNAAFAASLRSLDDSRALWHQDLAVAAPTAHLVPRTSIWTEFDAWLTGWPAAQDFLAVTGEEGAGKTWALAAWLERSLATGGADCPCVLFLTSSNVESNQPEHVLASELERTLPQMDQEQRRRRLAHWLNRDPRRSPLIILVLDGLNERHAPIWWRNLLEALTAEKFRSRIAVILTARSTYWDVNFGPLHELPVHRVPVDVYDDAEFTIALTSYGRRAPELPEELRELVRRPRFFEIVMQHWERVVASGDPTRARLIYEERLDYYRRKGDAPLTDDDFRDFVRDVARRSRDGIMEFGRAEILDALGPKDAATLQHAYDDLVTAGILQRDNGWLRVDPDRLELGFGLLLADIVRRAVGNPRPLAEVIGEWLEPQPGMDIKGRICEYAALHALLDARYPLAGQVALLQAWLSVQNPGEDFADKFASYLPLSARAYLCLAEEIWRTSPFERHAQGLLIQVLIRWGKDSSAVLTQLAPAFERWLGFVHIQGFPSQRGHDNSHAAEVQAKLAERIGGPPVLGPATYAGRRITFVHDDGLLRLREAALAIISHLPRFPFIDALVAGAVSETLMGRPESLEVMAWVLRTSQDDIGTAVAHKAEQLLAYRTRPARQAADRLARWEGGARALRTVGNPPDDLYDPNPLRELYRRDPCNCGFTWHREDHAICAARADLDPGWIARQLGPCAVDPSIVVAADTPARISALPDAIDPANIWVALMNTSEDLTFEQIEPALCAYAPSAIPPFLSRVIDDALERKDLPLRQFALGLQPYAYILGPADVEKVTVIWRRLLIEGTWEAADGRCPSDCEAEAWLFSTLLQHWTADEQLAGLLAQPDAALDSVAHEVHFAQPLDWTGLLARLRTSRDAVSIKRLLWFAAHSASDASPEFIEAACALLDSGDPVLCDDGVLRGLVCCAVYRSANPVFLRRFVDSGWKWSPQQHEFESHWGGLILAEHSAHVPFAELVLRIPVRLLGHAVVCRGLKKDELRSYAQLLSRVAEEALLEDRASATAPVTLEVKLDDPADSTEFLRWAAPSHDLTPESADRRNPTWQLPSPDDGEFERLFDFDARERQLERQSQHLAKVVQAERAAGNDFFTHSFSAEAIAPALSAARTNFDLLIQTALGGDTTSRQAIVRGRGFFNALCTVLLSREPALGAQLYKRIKRTSGGTRYIRSGMGLDLLDEALFAAPPDPAILALWRGLLDASTNDADLLEVVLLARSKDAHAWLWSCIRADLAGPVRWQRARALVLCGFLDTQEAEQYLEAAMHGDDVWLAGVAKEGLYRQQRHGWAKHWFRLFAGEPDRLASWAAFRLFLKSDDKRFYVWAEETGAWQLIREPRRLAFLQSQQGAVASAAKREAREYEKTFLGEKTLDGQVWPWMGMDGS